MTTALEALRAVSLVFGSFLMGGLVMELMMVIPLISSLPPQEGIRTFRFLSRIAWRYLPVCGVTMTATQVVIVLLSVAYSKPLTSTPLILTYVGLALSATGVATNLGPYLRADRRLRAIEPEETATKFPAALARVRLVHTVRLPIWIAAYTCFVVAAVVA